MAKYTPADAIEIARAAGLDTSGLEEQVAERAARPDLAEQVAKLGAELQRRVPEPPATPEQQERAAADQMLRHMNRSLTPWHEPGGNRGR